MLKTIYEAFGIKIKVKIAFFFLSFELLLYSDENDSVFY